MNNTVSVPIISVNSFSVPHISPLVTRSHYDFDLTENLERLNIIQNLPDNWNENGASAFSPNHIEAMRRILKSLSFQPFIAPTANDSIQFEYEDSSGNYLEFELFSDLSLKMFSCDSSGNTKKRKIVASEVNGLVRNFYKSANHFNRYSSEIHFSPG